jgi:hypothetical protein
VSLALDGADYHQREAFRLAQPIDGRANPTAFGPVVAHLRAYYWELWSVWDYILHRANSETLQLKEREVTSNLLNRLRASDIGYRHLDRLTAIYSSAEFAQIRRVRHAAHFFVPGALSVEYLPTQAVSLISFYLGSVASSIYVYPQRDLKFMRAASVGLEEAGFWTDTVAP